MHQYTADLANRLAAHGHRVDVVTTGRLPRDRYAAGVAVHTPIANRTTGFGAEGLNVAGYRAVRRALLAQPAAVVHITAPHLWNPLLIAALRRAGRRVIHTLHDLDPHRGSPFAALIRLWNRLVLASGCHILVHGRCYRDRLIARGIPAERVAYTPLLHGFLSADRPWPPGIRSDPSTLHPPTVALTVLFFGRVEAYKGVDALLAAWSLLRRDRSWGTPSYSDDRFPTTEPSPRLIIAGPVAPGLALPPLPPGVELRNRLILDEEAEALFRAADLLVLPYRDATQSALVAAAYAYGLPVIVTRIGALPEYVREGETGWVVPPGEPTALAAALATALADPDRLRRMGAAGRAWFEAHHREARLDLLTRYQTLIAESR